jgi:diacylglycerol kinase family enzyme
LRSSHGVRGGTSSAPTGSRASSTTPCGRLRDGPIREIDLGLARFRSWQGDTAEAYFANIASAGMSGAIAKRANETSKALGGKASYFWSTFAVFTRWRTSEISVRVGARRGALGCTTSIVANGRYLAGGNEDLP